MSILVAYVSKYGATEGIAERIAETLRALGQDAEVEPAKIAGELTGYDAFVIGSAVYNTHWMKEAAEFVRRNRVVLANSPVWLFSSGPLGTETTDQQGRELITVAEPKEIAEFSEAVSPRGHRVFFGALDRSKLGFAHRAVAKLPAAQSLLPQGDFRDWEAVEAWAESIADELADGQASRESSQP